MTDPNVEINQNVIYEHGGTFFTGKVAGRHGEFYKVLLDMPLYDGTTVVLVPFGIIRSLNCHWCRDTQRVATEFTGAQLAMNTIPTKPCPYC